MDQNVAARAAQDPVTGAADKTRGEAPARVIGIYMVGVLPQDLRQTLAFYRSLGVELTQDGERLHFAGRARGGVVFFVNATGLVAASDAPRVALECRLEGPAAVDEVYAVGLQGGGQAYRTPGLAPFGDYLAMLLDPDGNIVALSAPSERAERGTAQGGRPG